MNELSLQKNNFILIKISSGKLPKYNIRRQGIYNETFQLTLTGIQERGKMEIYTDWNNFIIEKRQTLMLKNHF